MHYADAIVARWLVDPALPWVLVAQHIPAEHAWHSPVHAASQQNPSTQLPLEHWPATEQVVPLPLSSAQVPPSTARSQNWFAAQLPSTEHAAQVVPFLRRLDANGWRPGQWMYPQP